MARRVPLWVWVAVVSAGTVAAGATVGITHAAFSGQTSNAGNTFSAASSFGCPAPESISPAWLSGLEHGYSTTAGGGSWNNVSGTASVDSGVKRTGTYSLKLAPAAAAAFRGRFTIASTILVTRFAIRFETLPSADVSELANIGTAANPYSYLTLRYQAGTQRFALGLPGQTIEATNVTVTAGSWYVIDMKLNVAANPHTAALRVNEGPEVTTSNALAASTVWQIYWGSQPTATFTANYDDFIFSHTAADWPIGDGKILALKPNAVGTNLNPTHFQYETNGAIDANAWQRLDDVPMQNSTDYIKQVTANTSSYVEVGFDDTAESCIRAVNGFVVFDPQNTNQANDGKTSIFDGSTERIIYDGDMAATSSLFSPKAAIIAPATAPWTQTAVNALKGRIGYSSDVSPLPRWHSLLLEYEIGQ